MADTIGGLDKGGEADKAARDGVPHYDTPFRDCVPPLTKKEYSVLKASICEEGLIAAIIIDECNNILDGHHRYRACLELGIVPSVRLQAGLGSESAKRVFVRGLAGKGRNLQAKQLKQVHESQKQDCRRLRKEDPKTWTLEKLAAMSGVDRSTVGKWCSDGISPIARPDARRKLTLEAERAAKSAIDAGESLSEVAKRYGVSKSRMGQIKSKQVVSRGDLPSGAESAGDLPSRVEKALRELESTFCVAELPDVRRELIRQITKKSPTETPENIVILGKSMHDPRAGGAA